MPTKKQLKQKVFSFNQSTAPSPDYVGYEVVKELTNKCSEIYASGTDLVAKLLDGRVVRVPRHDDFLTPYRDLLEAIKK